MSTRNFNSIILVLAFLAGCSYSPLSPSPVADYGDAPDGDLNMDTGYYAPFPSPVSPGVLIWDNAGIAADFPSVGTDFIPGPYMLDVDKFFIGPFAMGPIFGFPPSFNATDIPSVESDVTDTADPDGPSNLNPPSPITTYADCDKENASHNPVAPDCLPVPPYSINMNGILVIWIMPRVSAFFITRVWTSPTTETEEVAYWNMLFDIARDGKWKSIPGGKDEWVARDEVIPLNPGGFNTLITQPFPWPTSGPFGRLIFPVWARNMVSSESIVDALGIRNWDGRGPTSGFSQGEVEDYFIEWRPIGQILPEADEGSGKGRDRRAQYPNVSELPALVCPENIVTGQTIVCEAELNKVNNIIAICLPKGFKSGIAGDEVWISKQNVETKICSSIKFNATIQSIENTISLNVNVAPKDAAIALILLPDEEHIRGVGNVSVASGAMIGVTLSEKK